MSDEMRTDATVNDVTATGSTTGSADDTATLGPPDGPAAAAPAGGAQQTAPSPPADDRPRPRSRFGTIVWGVLILMFAGLVAIGQYSDRLADPWLLATIAVVAAGVVLVFAGVASALKRNG